MESVAKRRVLLLDELRGFLIIMVVLYHLLYDLYMFFHLDMPFFFSPPMELLKYLGAGSFILVSGIVCHYARSNLKRGLICLGFALAITVFTYIFMPTQVIYFGILHLLAVCMILSALLKKVLDRLPFLPFFILFAVLFLITFNIPKGYFGLSEEVSVSLPSSLYDSGLFFLGFPGNGFNSADYYPLIPFAFLFFAGVLLGRFFVSESLPEFVYRGIAPPFRFLGRHTLVIYLVHQPLILGIFYLVQFFIERG